VILKKIFNFFVYTFALVGFVLVSGFFAIRLGLTNVSGIIDKDNFSFEKHNAETDQSREAADEPQVKGDFSVNDIDQQIGNLEKIKELRSQNYCKLKIIGDTYPANVRKIIEAGEVTESDPIMAKMALAVELNFSKNQHLRSLLDNCAGYPGDSVDYPKLKDSLNAESQNIFPWVNEDEWQSVKEASKKEKATIGKVSQETGVEARLIVSNMIVEQLRLMSSEREIFKKFFEPLKILCSANKISLGVMGIKEATAIAIEEHLKDQNSPYYLGKEYEHLLDFNSGDVASERYDRLTDDKDHYYSYLYGALYLKQMMQQWRNSGYDITYRPEIIGTLFNVGFAQSKPKTNPKVGGSSIKIRDREYSFGSLAYEFYYSGELLEDFPYEIK
jgi:hypothetical protein